METGPYAAQYKAIVSAKYENQAVFCERNSACKEMRR